MFMITLFAKENFCDVFSSMVTYFFSAYTKQGLNSHIGTILLFKVSFDNNLIVFFIAVMQKNRN